MPTREEQLRKSAKRRQKADSKKRPPPSAAEISRRYHQRLIGWTPWQREEEDPRLSESIRRLRKTATRPSGRRKHLTGPD